VIEQGSKERLRQSHNEFTRQFLAGAALGPLRMD
jgi:hypothetical protein